MLSSFRQCNQQKNLTLTLLPGSPRPIFRPFCSDAIDVLWRYRAGEEVDGNSVLQLQYFLGLQNILICFLLTAYFIPQSFIFTFTIHFSFSNLPFYFWHAHSFNSFSAKRFIIGTTGRAPSLLGVVTTKVRFLGIWVSVWLGCSVAAVKPPQAVLPAA